MSLLDWVRSPGGQNALWTMLVASLCAVSCALLGCYLLLRRLSLLGDAISHSVLPGIALAYLLTHQISGWPIILGAMLLGLTTTFLTRSVTWMGNVPEDASIGVVFTSLFAVGVILLRAAANHTDLDPNCVLYGLIELVPLDRVAVLGLRVPRATLTLAPVTLVTILFVVVLWKELKLSSFDPGLATALGFHAAVIHYLLMAMVAMVTVASFEVVGSILVIAMLIVPAATAHLLTDRFGWMMGIACLVGVASSILGYLGAEWLRTNVAGMIAVVGGVQLGLAVLFAPRHGALSKVIRNQRLTLRIVREDLLAWLYRREEDGTTAAFVEDFPPRCRGLAGRVAMRLARASGELERLPDGRWRLTEAGRRVGGEIVRSHRLWEAWLGEELALPLDHLHEPAERMEHFIGPKLQEEIRAELKHGDRDPHGRPIPEPESPGRPPSSP